MLCASTSYHRLIYYMKQIQFTDNLFRFICSTGYNNACSVFCRLFCRSATKLRCSRTTTSYSTRYIWCNKISSRLLDTKEHNWSSLGLAERAMSEVSQTLLCNKILYFKWQVNIPRFIWMDCLSAELRNNWTSLYYIKVVFVWYWYNPAKQLRNMENMSVESNE